jgi:hypothetical protein
MIYDCTGHSDGAGPVWTACRHLHAGIGRTVALECVRHQLSRWTLFALLRQTTALTAEHHCVDC